VTYRNDKRVAMLLCAVSLTAIASPVSAQSQETSAAAAADASQDAPAAGDIVVTARKREERLSDVPVTVLASTGEQLQGAGVTDVSQLGRVAPSFTSTASVFGFQVFSIRGVNFNTQQASAPPAVAVYVDEAPLPYSVMTGGLLLDVERVEVLKGPQGTLFGQNATGGLINVIAAKPTDTFRAGVRADINHFGEFVAEGYVSGPLSDTLRARVAATTTQGGAWQKGYYLYDGENGSQNKAAARLLLDWTPTERLTVAVNVNGNYDKSEGIQPQLALVSPNIPANALPGLIGYPTARKNRDVEIDPGFDTRSDNRMIQGSVRADYELSDAVTLTSLTSYADFEQKGTDVNYDSVVLPLNYANVFSRIKSFSQEARLSGSVGDTGQLDYVLGASYSKDDIREGAGQFFNGASALPLNTNLLVDYALTAKATAVFGNVDFKVTPELTLSAGARYTWTRQSIEGCTFDGGSGTWGAIFGSVSQALRDANGLGPVPPGAFAPGTCATINDNVPNVANPAPGGTGLVPDFLPIASRNTQKENNFSWRGSISYKLTPDNMIYATVSRGFKAGVFPAQPNITNSQGAPVTQEQLTSYEIGAKLAFLDRAVRLNLAAFHYDYKDKQFYTYAPLPALQAVSSVIINIPQSKVNGFDADVTINPSDRLSIRAAVTYLDTEVQRLAPGQVPLSGLTTLPFDPTGKQFNYAPPWSSTFDVEYRAPVSERVEAVFGVGGQWYSKSYSDLGEEEALSNPAYVTVDLRAGLQDPDGRWRASLWVRNLTDKDYWSSIFRAGDVLSRYAGRPRTFGATIAYNFF